MLSDSEVAKDFGSKLKQARVQCNLKQTELADQIQLGKNIVSRFEAKGEGTIANLIPILRRLRLLDEFLNFIPQQTPDPKSIYSGTAPDTNRKRVRK